MTAEYIIDGKEYKAEITDYQLAWVIAYYLRVKHSAQEIRLEKLYIKLEETP